MLAQYTRNVLGNRDGEFSPCLCTLRKHLRVCPASSSPRTSPRMSDWRAKGPDESSVSNALAVCKRPVVDCPWIRYRARSPWSCSRRTPASCNETSTLKHIQREIQLHILD